MRRAQAEFTHLTLSDLRALLRDTLRHAVPSDREFIQRLSQEIATRERDREPDDEPDEGA